MKSIRYIVMALVQSVLLLSLLAGNSLAAIQSVGPTSTITTLPTWYMDANNIALAPCVDQNNLCILTPNFDPLADPATRTPPGAGLSTITTTGPVSDTNFPAEAFYYSAFAADPLGGAGKFTIENGEVVVFGYVLEFAFLSGVVPETAITFLRTDLQKMRNLTPNATYRVTHPYGVFEFQTDAAGVTIDAGPGIRFEDQPGTIANYLPPLFKSAPNTNIGPFLIPVGGAASFVTDPLDTTKVYIGDPVVPVQVTGSPNGNNFVLIERLNASGLPVASWQTDFFTLMGRVFTDQIPSPTSIDRVTYARNATSEQVDIFATALPNATLSVSGTGIPTGNLTQDTLVPGKFFSHIPIASTTLPTSVVLGNSLDTPSVPYPITLADEVNITLAAYNPITRDLTIKASSRDLLSPPTLTVPQFVAPNTLDATGTLVKNIPANTIPPMTVTVNSSSLGTATAFVSVVIPPVAPVAVNDSATTPSNTAVVINVLSNDTTTGTLDPTTVVTANAVGGTAVASVNGSVTFTPTNGFSGAASFTYTVADTLGQVSNSATVSVTVATAAGATSVTLTPGATAPQASGTPITFIAAASGGSGSYEYKFWLNDGISWTVTQDYSTTPYWTWNTNGRAVGGYTVAVDARNAGSGVARDTVAYAGYTLGNPKPLPFTSVNVTPSAPSPSAAPISFQATALGGTGTAEYNFWLFDITAGTWNEVQPYSTTSTWQLPLGTAAGDYVLGVNVRSQGVEINFETVTYFPYTVSP